MTHGHYKHPKEPKLKKTLSLFEITMYGVGLILGAGIYVLIGRGAAIAGNSLWLSFVVATIIAALTGLSYCELSSRFPKESAEYVYTKKTFNRNSFSFIIGWVLIFAGSVSATAVAMGFSEYFATLMVWDFSTIPFIAAGLIIILSIINFWGVKESARLNVIFTIVEMIGLLIIIAIGIPHLGSVDYLQTPGGGFAFADFSPIMAAAALIFFAYIGFDEMPKLIEETKNGAKVIPRALIYALVISTILYILVALSAVSVVPWSELKEAPLSTVVGTAWGPNGMLLMTIIALFATFNTVLAILMGFSRLMYGMASGGGLPPLLSRVHSGRRTPYVAILAIMVISLFFLILGDISILASVTDLGIFVVFFVINITLIALRYKDRKTKPHFKSPLNLGWFPIPALLGIIAVITIMLNFEPIIYLYELGIIVIGLIIYFILKSLKKI
ncbi:MAG: amino acid permease [Candidatus Aenigmarchaeota archaeon]|nr:amino acid permease [Candidatus Aenigmarchaeota archaeon]